MKIRPDVALGSSERSADMASRLASQVIDPSERRAIMMAYRDHGGTMSYGQIEKSFNLRAAKGMTAYRVVKRAEKESRDQIESGMTLPGSGFEVRTDPEAEKKEQPVVAANPKEEFNAVDMIMSASSWRKEARYMAQEA